MSGDTEEEKELSRSIKLPDCMEVAFRNLKDAKLFALDIGGSLTKIAYYSTLRNPRRDSVSLSSPPPSPPPPASSSSSSNIEGARLHFVKFETSLIETALNYVEERLMDNGSLTGNCIKVTGGGAYKFTELIEKKVGLPIDKVEEFDCMVHGCNFVLRNINDEVYSYTRKDGYVFETTLPTSNLFPYLLVQIGSGVSILKVESEDTFQRIGGTATGGGTFWGLGKLLTKAKGFDELLSLATKGDHRKVDMLVKDIYGGEGTSTLGLPADLIASSLGKAVRFDESSVEYTDADVARSLLYMISNDIGQISSLYALLHGIKTIYFGGFFLRHHPVSLHTIGYSVNYWTQHQVQAKFLRHEGYLGAIGAFLKGAKETERYSWAENLYGSTSFPCHTRLDHLEMDRYETRLSYCPLLSDPEEYIPDTVDLTRDNDAREYWLDCFRDSIDKFAERAVQSESEVKNHGDDDDNNDERILRRAEKFKYEYLTKLENFRSRPFAFGNLTVRALLDLREHCLKEFEFYDPYLRQKRFENEQAFQLLDQVLSTVRSLSAEEKEEYLVRGILAGNVFDWGAKEVSTLMESDRGLNFKDALNFIGSRPWLFDDLDRWIVRMRSEHVHKCAAIFIDNSGVDIVLGILPFVEHLLNRGTRVLLCANNRPVLNDVTYQELQEILQRASSISTVLRRGLETKTLISVDSGQSSPCLDLGRLNNDLVELINFYEVDLLILEGMGRAIHTNFYAKVKCECLKIAVLKNKWLANKLGGKLFSVVFKYEV